MALTQVTKSGITADAIDATKIADNAVDSEHIAADSIDAEHYAAGSVDATALGADAVTAAKIGDDVLNSEHYAATSIDNEHLADDAVDSDELAAGSVDTAHLSADCVTAAKIADDVIDSEHYAAASIDNEHLADDAVGVAELSATGTASSSTFLRGDNSWTAVSTPITALNSATANELVTVGATTTELDAETNLTFDGTDLTLGTGNLIIGTDGKGIDFSAAGHAAGMTSELLDDYEEGTWTPTFNFGGTTFTDTGTYIKIGRMCYFNIEMVGATASGTTQSVTIGDIPFSASYSSGSGICAPTMGHRGIAGTWSSIMASITGGTITLYKVY